MTITDTAAPSPDPASVELVAQDLLRRFPPTVEGRRTFRYGQQPTHEYPHLIIIETHLAHAQMRVEEGVRTLYGGHCQAYLGRLAELAVGATWNGPAAVEMPSAAKPDPVNHPSHYNSHPSGVECITIVEHFNFNIGNAIKYLWRAGEKGNRLEDLKKAEWYISRELDRLTAEGKPSRV